MSESSKKIDFVKILKILGRTFLVTVILLCVLLFCVVRFLDSKYLPPIVEQIADDYIDGKLKVGGIKLGFKLGFPILSVEVDSLTLTSNAFASLTDEERGLLPDYADSLLTLDHMSGSLDIKRLVANNELSLHDVVLRGLSVNLVIAHDGKANYEIIKEAPDTLKAKEKGKLPGFRINRFALESPKEIRFYNAADSTSASVVLLTDAAVESDKEPTYRLKINGNVTSPKAKLITNLEQISFGLDGKVYWNPLKPGLVAMDEFEMRGAFIRAVVTGEIDLTDSPIIRRASVDVAPIAATDLLTLLPDSIRALHHLYAPYFATDLRIGGRFELTKPMNLATDTLPSARIRLEIPPATLTYGKARFEGLAFDADISTVTNRPDSTVVNITRCVMAGPATRLEASALLTTLISDPSFALNVQGDLDLNNLPPFVHEKIPGYISGVITADLKADGRGSMLTQEHIHKLVADGYLKAENIYFLSADTSKMVQLGKARIDFDSKKIVADIPQLNAKLDVDTANILIGGVDVAFSSLSLNAGVEGEVDKRDTISVPPIGGRLQVNRLNIISITDSAGGRIRNLTGDLTLQRSKKQDRIPEILANLQTGRVSAGSLSDRIILNDTKIQASLLKLPSSPEKQKASSKSKEISREYSYIKPELVFKYVYAKRHHKKHTKRVYTTQTSEHNEMLEWNLAKGFSKFLNQWKLRGAVTTRDARLLTPLLPLRNHFSHIDLKFNNDTVNISDISLRIGKSDIALSGLVTNVKRALTSKTDNNLKANLALLSDTIDINQLASGVFIGSAYAHSKRKGRTNKMDSNNDADLEKGIIALAKEDPGKSAPFLIPLNVNANLKVGANKVLYSDLILSDMGGDMLVYDGGVNLHDMRAVSDAGSLSISALYSAPRPEKMHFGFGLDLKDFNIGKFVRLVPAIDSITPLLHDFSGMINADIAATCRIDSGMNIVLPTLDAAIRITGDNLAFIDPKKYRTLGKWLGFKDKADNTIHRMNVEMTVADGVMRVYPFAFNIDRYRLGIYGYNDIAMNFDYHISVLKSPLPFKFGITISGNPKKHKVRFGGAKFKEDTAIESVSVVNDARINLIDQIENVFKRGVRNSRFLKLQVARPAGYDSVADPGLSAADSLQLIREGLMDASLPGASSDLSTQKRDNSKDSSHGRKEKSGEKKKKRKRWLFF